MDSKTIIEAREFAILPITIFKDFFEKGNRISEVCLDDTFKQNHRAILKSLMDVLNPEYVFTKYHYHDGIEIIRINEGSGTVIVNNQAYPANAGDVFVFNAFEAHGIYLLSTDNCFSRTCIAFRPHYLFPPESDRSGIHFFADLKKLNFENHLPSTHPAAPLICEIVDRIVDAYLEKNNAWSAEAFSLIMRFYSIMIRFNVFKKSDENATYMHEFMIKVSTYIEENLDQDIATTDVATFCQYSTEHFCRLFKKCFNKTFKSYLNIYRIRRAKELIDSGKFTTIAALSTTVGFNNQNHFGHMFKKYVGILPSEYISHQK
jgi:AraC-like DNA-binding protein